MPRTALLATFTLLAATTVPAIALAPADAARAPQPRLTAKAVTVGESARKAVVRLTLSSKARKTVKVAWQTADGTARAGSDYVRARGTVTIKKGKRTAAVTVRIVDDAVHEGIEGFRVVLASKQARAPKPVTVTVRDDDAATATRPSALTGTITVQETSMGISMGTKTLMMNLRLVPTAVAGEWRDNGTGAWTMSGSTTGFMMPPCLPSTTTIAGAGSFLTTAGTSTTDKAALVLSGFDPVTGTGTPSLAWDGTSAATATNYFPDPMTPGICNPSTVPTTVPFSLPGASGTYTGSTGPTRGVSFGFAGPSGAGTVTVTGTLTPVP